MRTKSFFLGILCLICSFHFTWAQNLSGTIYEIHESHEHPLEGANVYWLNTQIGAVSDSSGKFNISRPPQAKFLVISFIGFRSDTLEIAPNTRNIEHTLHEAKELQTIVVKGDKGLDQNLQQAELLDAHDLTKAACCNLSESFETNASVDVSTTDAVSGTKRIRMLGLDGLYSQIMSENLPAVRGLSARNGLLYIPGTWVSSIDINKGAGSVANGYESFTGQINVELAKPDIGDQLELNAYANQGGRLEANVVGRHKLSERWSTALLAHASTLGQALDQNDDGYMDTPQFTMLTAMNRWKYNAKYMMAQFGVKAVYDNRFGGQVGFKPEQAQNVNLPYGFNSEVRRLEIFGKTGFVSKKNANTSLGILWNAIHHSQNNAWGLSNYEANQDNINFNLIFQTELSPKHKIRTGASFMLDRYNETYAQEFSEGRQVFERFREELVPGVFVEHTYKPIDKLSLVSGLRTDFHNLYGTFLSPRMHLRYSLSDNSILRLSGGRGFRVANPIAENMSYFISARRLSIAADLQPEIAWNYGGSMSQLIPVNGRELKIVLDFYRTQFENQVVLDLDNSPNALRLYNLDGSSFANSFQVSVDYEIIDNFEISTAYKRYQVRSTIDGELRDLPFVPQNRFFVNLGYATSFDKWQFDFTWQWIGQQRLPDTDSKPNELQLASQTDPYSLMSAQVTKRFKGGLAIYIGGENLTNFQQDNPILAGDNPFGNDFDAGMIYAPVMGRMIYAGLRFNLK